MSTGTRLSLTCASANAILFRGLFPIESFERWEIAGSIRRRKTEVGDVEHVIINREPRGDDAPDMFRGSLRDPGVLTRLSGLVMGGVLVKHTLPDGTHRWGDKYRAVEFEGVKHDCFFAVPDNWGAILAIRTGPREYSRELMVRLRHRGLRMVDGYVRNVTTAGEVGSIVPCPTEDRFFELCGLPWLAPEKRGGG